MDSGSPCAVCPWKSPDKTTYRTKFTFPSLHNTLIGNRLQRTWTVLKTRTQYLFSIIAQKVCFAVAIEMAPLTIRRDFRANTSATTGRTGDGGKEEISRAFKRGAYRRGIERQGNLFFIDGTTSRCRCSR